MTTSRFPPLNNDFSQFISEFSPSCSDAIVRALISEYNSDYSFTLYLKFVKILLFQIQIIISLSLFKVILIKLSIFRLLLRNNTFDHCFLLSLSHLFKINNKIYQKISFQLLILQDLEQSNQTHILIHKIYNFIKDKNYKKNAIIQRPATIPLIIIEDFLKKKMSVTVSTCDQICNSPSNTSPSKMLYTFPKTSRFNSRKLFMCDQYYNIPSTVSGCRTTSLGFGHKYDFTHDAPKNPPPNTYDIPSTFTPNKTIGFGFGKGREQMEMTGPLASVRTNKNPGPGSYQHNSTLSKSAYSLTKKPHEEDRQRIRIPGPGAYPVTFCINQKGNYFLSKYKSSCVRDFSKNSGRPQIHTSKIPGPGSYDTSHVDLSPNGRYAVSKMRNCLTRKFAITTRKPIAQNNENPGPGNYRLPSDFGFYVSRKAFEETNRLMRDDKLKSTDNLKSTQGVKPVENGADKAKTETTQQA